jgi:hypothetical protein
MKKGSEEDGEEGKETSSALSEENRRDVIRAGSRVLIELFAYGCNCFLSNLRLLSSLLSLLLLMLLMDDSTSLLFRMQKDGSSGREQTLA